MTPVPSDHEYNDDDDDDDDEPIDASMLLEVPRHLSFSTMLSPIEENGETPTSESVTLVPDLKTLSTSDLISASSMEELKEFLMLETLYTN